MSPLPFHPLINAWFTETYGKPTPVQEEAWPLIAKGEHVLALAPTGSGKTLTGFLAAISRFAEGAYPADRLSVLYVSPLKALNEDIRRNLTLPLEGIRARFEKEGEFFPAIRAETRSGDTPQSERRRFLSRPPSILALTPESLGILLLNPRGRDVLSAVRYVILDEIHAALGSKRGCFLSCQIDRLALIAGEFQRVALSATVKPPEAAADFAGGIRKISNGAHTNGVYTNGVYIDGSYTAGYEKRKVHIVAPEDKKELRFQVIFPGDSEESVGPGTEDPGVERYGKRYAELVRFIMERIKAKSGGDSILVFTDSRRRAERINYLLNDAAQQDADLAGRPLSYTHHGSLSKEVRRAVEKALAAGEIPCVVATGSLELGIDIGGVEEVILAGSPASAAQALQRVGRSGHGVGMTSRGWLIPFHGMDLLQAAALSGAVEEKELEETASIENPLDILAQIILAFCTERDWNEEELYETIRGFYVYRNLPWGSYDGVVRMLAGAYEGTRLRELKRRIFRDDETKTLSAAPGALILLYTSGGVITSRGYYSLRLAPGTEGAGTKIGELDEEFVWERRLGDCFDFGNRSWKITAIGDEAVEALPLPLGIDYAPFWKAESIYRGDVLSRRMLELLDTFNQSGGRGTSASGKSGNELLACLSPEARNALSNFLYAQKSFQGKVPLPGPFLIPVEIIDNPAGRGDSCSVIFHTMRGGAVNYPLSLALAQDMEAQYGLRVEGAADDNAVHVRIPRSVEADSAACVLESLRRLCEGGKGEARFRERLESSGVFGAAFREAAERSLLLPRAPFGKRIPLWVMRQRSKRLFDAVSSYRDFPAAAEAWRTCLLDSFDMKGFSSLLDDIRTGTIALDFFRTRQPSPFSKELSWAETNTLIYTYDERPDLLGPPSRNGAGPSLSDQVIAEALGDAGARPPLKAELVGDFCSRLRRELPGWAPEDAVTLSEWVKERIAIPAGVSAGTSAGSVDGTVVGCIDIDEWEKLLECVPSELAQTWQEDKSLGGKLVFLKRAGAKTGALVHREWAKKWKEAGAAELAASCLGQWLRYEGPLPPDRIADIFSLSPSEAEEAVQALAEQGELVRDVIVEGRPAAQPGSPAHVPFVYSGTGLVCDRENLELLLRLGRRKQRPEVKERAARFLVPFLARRQGLLPENEKNAENVADNETTPWKHLSGIAAPAKLWETEFFPCRRASYSGETLDREIREGRLLWYGAGREKAAFCRPEDLDLVLPLPLSLSAMEAASATASTMTTPFRGKLSPDFFNTPRTFWEIKDALAARNAGIDSVAEALWEEVWKGGLSADSWEPLRRALELGFTSAESSHAARLAESSAKQGGGSSVIGRRSLRVPRAIRERWRMGPPVRGNWFSLAGDSWNPKDSLYDDTPDQAAPIDPELLSDPLKEEELNRDRVRLLLDRWGVLARPLLEREAPCLSWSRLLPAMRRMELAGELVAGRFFSGINSLQFASPRIAEELEEAEAEHGIYWMNATDPASPAGLAIDGITANASSAREHAVHEATIHESPIHELTVCESSIRRIPSTRLCFRGAELLAVSNQSGKSLEIFIPPDDPDIAEALAFLKIPRTRKIQSESRITIDKINGSSAAGSVYSPILADLGFVKDRGKMILW